ncbi:tyrosine-type recombinase/integrase [Myroides sp. WP-1]|uniref:tyrosine-type recombinase/integrase n=1 Tax=Myroides sp. WP-1 TaxID=2759944 RepID=UPI0015F91F31|nr:tyrosine-type recombinase/integrase [Myroides sp. WP-1]MBB1138637.1 tyrosine-type recombinase/integrase [Myroides sp. WP-1]
MDKNLEKFLEYLAKEKNYSRHTIEAYQNDIAVFLGYLEESEKNYLLIKYDAVRSWIVVLMETGMSKRSINRKMSALKAFYKFLMKISEVEVSPLQQHKTLKVEKKLQLPFSMVEVDAVRIDLEEQEGFDALRDLVIVEMLYCLGLRRSELCGVQVVDVDFYTKMIRITGKGNKVRYVPMIDTLIALLKRYLIERANVLRDFQEINYFLIDSKGAKVDEIFVYRVINLYFSKTTTKEKNSPHMLRHAFATHLLENGADINSIKELMGHQSLASTEVYAHVNLKELKETYMKTHPRLRKNK